MRSVFAQNEPVANGLKRFTLKLASPAAERIGWDFKPNEDYLTVQLRKLLIGMAGLAGDERYVNLLIHHFSRDSRNPE